MGLDMYAYSRNDDANSDDKNEIYYWRKFNALHGWMEALYREKGGKEESFNCVEVELTGDDLIRLQRDALNDVLKPTDGFFFGAQTIYPEDRATIFEFVSKGLAALSFGDRVFYNSWW